VKRSERSNLANPEKSTIKCNTTFSVKNTFNLKSAYYTNSSKELTSKTELPIIEEEYANESFLLKVCDTTVTSFVEESYLARQLNLD